MIDDYLTTVMRLHGQTNVPPVEDETGQPYSLELVEEEFEGQRQRYLVATFNDGDNGSSVRIDLDYYQWLDLADGARKMAERFSDDER